MNQNVCSEGTNSPEICDKCLCMSCALSAMKGANPPCTKCMECDGTVKICQKFKYAVLAMPNT